MARPIDEKIVAMKMDNSDFKRKAIETTSLFGKLRDSLNKIPGVNIGKVTNDLNSIQRAANSTDLSVLSKSVDAISGRFSALGVIATTALVNITNRAVNAGMALSKSLGMDQVKEGFREYETKMGSIQTILANTQSKGTTLSDVNTALEELNLYADRTIYSFSDMTRNIGLFTNAGLELRESTSMIKGFSNAAAASGATSEKAANAAYQLSQGLSQGYIMQMDWMSLTNAGMGNDNMKRDLIAMGQAMGTLNRPTETAITNWKELLSKDKWLTSDVMSKYLQTMAGDLDKATLLTMGLTEAQADLMLQNAQTGFEAATYVRTFTQLLDTLKEGIGSGWATTSELIFGDFEDATRMWTAISDLMGGVFQKQADARNNMLRSLIAGDGIENFLTGIANVAEPIIQILKAIGEGFKVAFPPMGVSGIQNLLEGFKNLTSGLTLSGKSVENIKTIFAGFFSVFAIGWDIVKGAVSIILALIPSFSGLGSKILELIAKVAQIPISFNKANESGGAFGSVMEGLKTIASGVSSALEFIVGGLIKFADTAAMAFGVLSTGKVSDGPWKDTKIADWLLKVREGFSSVGEAIGSINWSAVGGSIASAFGSLKTVFEWIIDKATAVRESIKNAIPTGTQLFQGGFIAALTAMVGMAIKMAWDMYFAFTGWAKMGNSIKEVLEGVGDTLNAFSWQVRAQALLTIAFAVGVLALSFLALSRLTLDDVAVGLYAIVGSLMAITLAMAVMSKYNIAGTGLGAAVQIVALAIAVNIMAGALNKMKDMKWSELSKGIVGLIGVMGTFSIAMIAISKFSGPKVAASALQFVGLAIAMHILISAIEKLADIKPAVIVKGVTALAAMLVALGIFLAISSKSKFGAASALGILGIATAILLIVTAVRSLGEMDVEVLKQGLTTIGFIIAYIGIFAALTANAGLLATGAGIFLLAAAMNLLMVPIFALGKMDIVTLAKGLGAMAIALLAIGGASMLMTGMLASGAGLILMAVALNMLLVPILAMSVLSWGALTIGIVGLAGGILLIGGAAALLGLAAPALLLGAAGILAIGLAMMAAGAGISLFGAGLVALAGMTGTAITTIVAMLGTLLLGLISLIPTFVEFLYKLNMSILEVIEEHTPLIINKIYDMMIDVIHVLTERVPEFADAATDMLVAFLNSMAEQLPRIIDAASNLMLATIVALAVAVETKGPIFLDAFKRLMTEIAVITVQTGVIMVSALFGWLPGVTAAANVIGRTAEENIRGSFDAEGTGIDKGVDFASSLASASGDAELAAIILAMSAEDGASTADLNGVASDQGDGYSGGILSKVDLANTAGVTLSESGVTGAKSIDWAPAGEFLSLGLAEGIESDTVMGRVAASAKLVAQAGYFAIKKFLDIRSPSHKTHQLGEDTSQGLANGVISKEGVVVKATQSLAGKLADWLGLKSATVQQATIGGQATGENFAKGLESSKKKTSKAAKKVGKGAGKDAASEASKAFKEAMDAAEHKFKMGKIDSTQYIAELEKIKRAYSKQPQQVREVESEIKKVTDDASKARFESAKKAIDDGKYYNKLSLQQELASWTKIQGQYKVGSKERSDADREVYRLKNEIVKQGFANEKKAIDDRKYYNNISLAQELTSWQNIQKKYKEGTEERKEADREVYRLKNELVKQGLANEKKAIDDLKQYNKLSLADELDAWVKIQAKYKQGTEERKEADREVYRLKNDLNKKIIDLNDDYASKVQDANKQLIDGEKQFTEERDRLIKDTNDKRISEEKRITDEYDNELKNRTNSLTNFAGIFEKVTSKKVSGKTLLKNAKGQLDVLTKWTEDFKKLSGRGLDEGLLKTLREMGPKSADEIAGLNTLTDEQLVEYSNIWKTKSEIAKVEATDQLQELRTTTHAQIQQLQIDTAMQLQQINNDWYNKVQALRAQTAVQLSAYQTEWLTKIEQLREGTEKEFVKLEKTMTQIGEDVIKGMMVGMKGMEGPLMAQAKAIADAVSKTIKGTLQIKSPSRITTGYGEDTGQGLANGLANKVKVVANNAKALAMTAKDSINDFLDGFELPEGDNELHFKAVVDYEKIDTNKFGRMNLIPDTSFTTNSAEATKAYKRQNGNINPREADRQPSVETKSTVVHQNLHFHTKEMTPSEVARKNIQASRQLALQ